MFDEMMKNNGTNLIYAAFTPYENYKLNFVEQAYGLKSSVAGGSDGGAHCGLICDNNILWNNKCWVTNNIYCHFIFLFKIS